MRMFFLGGNCVYKQADQAITHSKDGIGALHKMHMYARAHPHECASAGMLCMLHQPNYLAHILF